MTATLPPRPGRLPAAGPATGVLPAPVAGPASLTAARLRAGLTTTALAARLHVSRPTVAMWESGARPVTRVYWPALAVALSLEPREVAGLLGAGASSRLDGRRLPGLGHARRRAGFTQRRLAGRLGVAPTTLSMWETGRAPVPERLLTQVAQLLATDLGELSSSPPPGSAEPDPRPLRALRRAARMTQREAATHLRTSVGALARYEAGQRATPVAVVRRMAVVYQRSVGDVLRCSGAQLLPLPPGPWSVEQLPQVLRALRSAGGLTAVQVGRGVGRSGRAVHAWEAGRTRPTVGVLATLEVFHRLPPGSLTSVSGHSAAPSPGAVHSRQDDSAAPTTDSGRRPGPTGTPL